MLRICVFFTYTGVQSTITTFAQPSSTTIASGIYVSANQPTQPVPPHIVASLASSGIIPATDRHFVQLPPSVTSEQALALVQETISSSANVEGIMQNSTGIMQTETGILPSTAIQVSPSVVLTEEKIVSSGIGTTTAAVSFNSKTDSLGTVVGNNQVTPVISVMQCQPELTNIIEMTDSAICLTEGSETSSAENLMEQFYSNRQQTSSITPTHH